MNIEDREVMFVGFWCKEVYYAFFIAIAVTALWAGAFAHLIYTDVWTYNEVGAYLDRAVTAADAHDMKLYLIKFKEALEEHGMTRGYFAFVYKNAKTDMAECYKIVCNLIDRLDRLEKMRKDDVEYQLMLMDVRDDLKELDIALWKWYYVNHFPPVLAWLMIYIWSWLGLILTIAAWINFISWY